VPGYALPLTQLTKSPPPELGAEGGAVYLPYLGLSNRQTDAAFPRVLSYNRDRDSRFGLRVTVVADGGQVPSFLDGDRADLIVLDIVMPGDDGVSGPPRRKAQGRTGPDAGRPHR
jgi:CheY-like chemotaxis protein